MSQEQNPLSEPDDPVDYRHELISSRRVEGTPVYNRSDERLGSIHSVMIEKQSGNVAYAVLSFGGIFGLGEHVHPVPWQVLNYDVGLDAYVVDISREELAKMRRRCTSTRRNGRSRRIMRK